MGRGCDRPELRRWPGDNSGCAGKNAQRHEKEIGCAAKRRSTQGRPGTTVLHVLARVHVEICQALHTIGGEVYWWRLRHYSRPPQTDVRPRASYSPAGAESCTVLGRP